MMCLFGLFSVNAQETITIGEKTNVDAQFPMHTWWEYSYSQQIYTRSEINHGAANILKIAFFGEKISDFFWQGGILAVVLFVLIKKFKFHPVVYIGISALVGVIFKFSM